MVAGRAPRSAAADTDAGGERGQREGGTRARRCVVVLRRGTAMRQQLEALLQATAFLSGPRRRGQIGELADVCGGADGSLLLKYGSEGVPILRQEGTKSKKGP